MFACTCVCAVAEVKNASNVCRCALSVAAVGVTPTHHVPTSTMHRLLECVQLHFLMSCVLPQYSHTSWWRHTLVHRTEKCGSFLGGRTRKKKMKTLTYREQVGGMIMHEAHLRHFVEQEFNIRYRRLISGFPHWRYGFHKSRLHTKS